MQKAQGQRTGAVSGQGRAQGQGESTWDGTGITLALGQAHAQGPWPTATGPVCPIHRSGGRVPGVPQGSNAAWAPAVGTQGTSRRS